MSDQESLSKNSAQPNREPVAALFSPDLMFLVRLQNMARAAGFTARSVRADDDFAEASVLVVNLGATSNFEPLIARAVSAEIPVIAFGPHMDADSRSRAKAVGASRVLANSNVERDLPRILQELREGKSEL